MDYLKKAEQALSYLETSEQQYAELKAQVKYAPERLKSFLSTLELKSDASTATMKKAEAMAHEEYQQLIDAMETVTKEYNLIAEKRRRAELIIEMYRSVNSAMKRGNV